MRLEADNVEFAKDFEREKDLRLEILYEIEREMGKMEDK